MRECNLLKLKIKCEMEKRRLIDLAWKYGLEDMRVIKQSQKVDKLDKELQRRLAG